MEEDGSAPWFHPTDWPGLFDVANYPIDLLEESNEDIYANLSANQLPPKYSDDLSGVHSYIPMENAEEMQFPWKNNPDFWPIVTTHVFTFIVGLAGNIVVILTMRRQGEKSVTSIFLVSLAVSDLLLVAICGPLETLSYFLNPWTEGGRLCQLQSYVEMLSAVASVLNLTAVSLERYLVIVYPIQSRSLCTLHNCRRALIFVWIFALLLTAPVIVTRDSVTYVYYNNKTSVAVHYCMDTVDIAQGHGLGSYSGFLIALYQLLIMLVLPLLLMIVCYSRVIKELWLSTKQISALTMDHSSTSTPRLDLLSTQQNWNSGSPNNLSVGGGTRMHQRASSSASSANNKYTHGRSGDGAIQARKQVIKMLILVVVLFLVCWGPRLLLNTLIKWGLPSFDHTVYQLRVAFYLMPFIHSCINPFIYGFMSTNFRRTMLLFCNRRRRLTRCCCCRRKHENAQTVRSHSTVFEMNSGLRPVNQHCNYGDAGAPEPTTITHVPNTSVLLRPSIIYTTQDL